MKYLRCATMNPDGSGGVLDMGTDVSEMDPKHLASLEKQGFVVERDEKISGAEQVAPVLTDPSRLVYDPAELKKKTLEELNMALHHLKIVPANTKEEAIKILSRDFKPAVK